MFSTYARVDPLTSILAAMARSWQILTTSWQPWIPWQNSHKDLTKKYLYPKIVYDLGIKILLTKILPSEFRQPEYVIVICMQIIVFLHADLFQQVIS